MAKQKTKFVCQECGYESHKWMGRCPGCQEWNTLVEEFEAPSPKKGTRNHTWSGTTTVSFPEPITSVTSTKEERIDTTLPEFNRVLGGGIVPGSLVLVGGDPGIGKSTLLLQISSLLANQGNKVLYISGEESVKQTKLRADRLGVSAEKLYVFAETNMELIEKAIDQVAPTLVIIDSIQTVHDPNITSAPGSVAQVRESTALLMKYAKTRNIAIFVVGHVTKQGAIAGPKLLEHMVDSVLYFEGERHHTYRILRAVKNRFGSTNEIGIFEMREKGLAEVKNPSEIFLEDRTEGSSGSIVVASLEGTRPVLVEVQALIAPSSYANPRRTATGIDHNRIALLMAVLEKRIGMLLQNQDAYLNVAGGVKLDEPAIDLGLAICIASSYRNHTTYPGDVVIGEVGLTGEVRRVSRIEERIQEAAKLGFKRAIVPAKNVEGWKPPEEMEVIGVSTLEEALDYALIDSSSAWYR
ncbi:DNA repair protein RadA [Aliibacillus thermotolerans]|uniref:DNA repair protein RadA n=1 Tax=Aliibacillus thermotolerans TaxID=1834418 RepID=A0ABW0UB16_9BACI|nr:DNA repair protein RadA [Aliibacillus thermotolerans]MDA3128889.1 DNA repair protein RadA [Aliibacillus thermotolerans]